MSEPKNPEEVYSPHTIILSEREQERKEGFTPAIITRDGHSVGKTEEYKRSDHADFAYASELRDRNFSGIRDNQMAQMRELWLDGNLVGSLSYTRMALDPTAWENFYAEKLGLGSVVEAPIKGN